MISAIWVHFRGTKNCWTYDILISYTISFIQVLYHAIHHHISKHDMMCTHPRPLAVAVPADLASAEDDDSDRVTDLLICIMTMILGMVAVHLLALAHQLEGLRPGHWMRSRFIQELEDLSSLNGPDISAAVNDLPLPREGDVSCVSVQEAVAVSSDMMYDIGCDLVYDIVYDISTYLLRSCSQAGLIQPPSADDRLAFTPSERILMDFQKLKRLNALVIKNLIQDVLHNENFDSDEDDHNMHDRLMCAVTNEMIVHDMWQEGVANRTLGTSNARSRL